jgi:hypothetical protein
MSIISSSKEPTSANAGHALTSAPIGPWPKAVRQVGADSGHDADAEAACRQWWDALVPAAGVEYHHRGGPDQAVHRERQQPGSQAMLPVGADEFIGMLAGDDRGDAGDGDYRERRREADKAVGHRSFRVARAVDIDEHLVGPPQPGSHSRLTDWVRRDRTWMS